MKINLKKIIWFIVILPVLFPIKTLIKLIKNISNELIRKYIHLKKESEFRHIFISLAISIGTPLILLVLILLKFNLFEVIIYLILYSYFILFTFLLIVHISKINKVIKKDENILRKWDFFTFIIKYIFIMILYVFLFSLVLSYTFDIHKGSLYLNDKLYPLDFFNSLFVSGITFVSYDIGLVPEGIMMKLIIFLEIFLSQVIILGFAFIVFSQLLGKLNEK